MKQLIKAALVLFLVSFMVSSCNVFKRTPKEGCPTNGKNVGAEKLLSGEKVKRVKKFNS